MAKVFHVRVLRAATPNPSVNRTACKLRFSVPSGLRPLVAHELARWASQAAYALPLLPWARTYFIFRCRGTTHLQLS